MSLTRHLDYRHLILCAPPRSIRFPMPLTCLLTRSIVIGLHTSRLCGSFPHPHKLTPTHSTTGLASWTKPLLQSAPSVLHLVRVFTAKTDWAPVVLLGSCLGIRSNKPVSCRTHFPPFLQRSYSHWHVWTRGESHFHRHMDEPQDISTFFVSECWFL